MSVHNLDSSVGTNSRWLLTLEELLRHVLGAMIALQSCHIGALTAWIGHRTLE